MVAVCRPLASRPTDSPLVTKRSAYVRARWLLAYAASAGSIGGGLWSTTACTSEAAMALGSE